MQHLLQAYLRRLTNLSAGNRSLLLTRLGADQHMDLKRLDFALDKPAFHIVSELISGKKSIPLCQVIDSRSASGNELSQQLRKLQRSERQIWEERGSKDLYVGWPIVEGKFMDESVVRAPLVFFPVSLNEEKSQWVLRREEGLFPQLNKSFLLSYYFFNGLPPNENLLEYSLEEMDTDPLVFRTQLYEVFKEEGLELHFNPDNFADQLQPFFPKTREELESDNKMGMLRLFPQAILGIFPQAGSYLVPDYLHLIANNQEKEIEDFFQSTIPKQARLASDELFPHFQQVKEEHMLSPFLMDAYQEQALKKAKSGQSMVVQGPPGTGKSQLICNLIADYAARGMRVLLVSQKRAALDVVYQRLSALELDQFIGLVHDFKNDRKDILKKMATQIHKLDEYRNKNNSLDAIQLERQFTQTSRRIDQITEELEEFKQVLFTNSTLGLSVKEMYLNSDPGKPHVNFNQFYKDLPAENLSGLISHLKSFLIYARKFRHGEHPWTDRKNLGQLDNQDIRKIKELFEELPAYRQKVQDRSQVAYGKTIDIDVLDRLREQKEYMAELISILKDADIFKYFVRLVKNEQEPNLLWLSNTERVILDCFKHPGPEISVPASDLGLVQEAIQKKLESKGNPRKYLQWKLFSKDKFLLSRVLVANQLLPKRQDLKLLIDKVDSRLNLEHNISKLKEQNWLHDIPSELRKIEFQTWFFLQKKAIKAYEIFKSLRGLEDIFKFDDIDNVTFCSWLAQIQNWINELDTLKTQWLRLLTPSQINQILLDADQRNLLQLSFEKDAQELYDFDRLLSQLSNVELSICELIWDYYQESQHEVPLEALFYNSLYLSWIEEIERKHPILKSTGTIRFDRLQQELREAISTKQAISDEILKLKLRENTYAKVEYNRLHNRVTYRDLEHQVNKKRRIWPLRKFFANFPGDIFSLMPCWMASPESVSAIFPMREMFDLVIFDEASQCFAEKGLPAIHRAKQVIIAGDPKQLSPFDLYKVRWESDDEENPDLEIDSLLDLSRKYLPEVTLQGHYRSKRAELIHFSNTHFYHQQLKVLPDRLDINQAKQPIHYDKVEGMWKNQRNELEGDKVIDWIKNLQKEDSSKSIGVVTFNAAQQALILDKLEEAQIPLSKKLFVKNIENVQGDEADIILFSLGYAPDDKGKLQMQFGSLNARGGENRLNVAVTRAKERIILVASIWPEQLHVEESTNPGPQLLKEYLRFARSCSEGSLEISTARDIGRQPSWYLASQLSTSDMPFPMAADGRVPLADLVIKSNNEVRSLILTDDQHFYASLSVKDAMAYLPEQLERQHWKWLRIYSREWWNNREQVEERLKKFIAQSHV